MAAVSCTQRRARRRQNTTGLLTLAIRRSARRSTSGYGALSSSSLPFKASRRYVPSEQHAHHPLARPAKATPPRPDRNAGRQQQPQQQQQQQQQPQTFVLRIRQPQRRVLVRGELSRRGEALQCQARGDRHAHTQRHHSKRLSKYHTLLESACPHFPLPHFRRAQAR
eukprot:COSAG02_NODE_5103_length_4628_cov_3.366085_4_plen_167_part_00